MTWIIIGLTTGTLYHLANAFLEPNFIFNTLNQYDFVIYFIVVLPFFINLHNMLSMADLLYKECEITTISKKAKISLLHYVEKVLKALTEIIVAMILLMIVHIFSIQYNLVLYCIYMLFFLRALFRTAIPYEYIKAKEDLTASIRSGD